MRAFLVVVLASLPLAASGAARQKIAVLDVRAVQGVAPGTATILTAIVVDDTARGGYEVISQADVSAMIGFEKQKQMLGCSDDSSCLAEIGGALGVDFVLSGQVGQIGSRYHLSFQILDSRRARVVSRAARFSERDDDALAAAAQGAVKELLQAAAAAAPRAAPKLDLSARPAAPAPSPAAAASKADRPSGRRRTLAWVALGGGAALLAGGVVFGLQANARRDELKDGWRRADYPSFYDDKSKEAKSAALTANVLYGAAAVSTGVGAWLWWTSRPGAVAVAPVAGEGRVGLVAAGRF
jgi:TolB-like protein